MSVRDTEAFYYKNQVKDFHYHEKHQQLQEIFSYDFQGAEVRGPNHFKTTLFAKFSSVTRHFHIFYKT